VLKVLRRENPKGRILATDTTVTMGDLIFFFGKNGRLERVQATAKR
jgi:Trk K+ transport system NAD-binding subunit